MAKRSKIALVIDELQIKRADLQREIDVIGNTIVALRRAEDTVSKPKPRKGGKTAAPAATENV